MYKGKPTQGNNFYNLLEKSEEFTSELGKVALASGKLEAELIIYLELHDIKGKYKRATLGTLIEKVETNGFLDKNIINAIKMISKQRNYITHNIYALFIDKLDETILEKNDLLDSDVHLYIERVWQLNENINGLAEIIKQKNER